VELVLEDNCIVLKAVAESRKNWKEAFAKMHRNDDDQLLIDSVFDNENWD
jgi:antitoxin MazE